MTGDQQRLADLELAMRETDHRVANSLQLTSALIRIQAMAVGDTELRNELFATQRRIDAIAMVHQMLSRERVASVVPLHDYVDAIVSALRQAIVEPFGHEISTELSQLAYVRAEHAICIGMAVNELVSNACKYAFMLGKAGRIHVCYRFCDQRFLLTIEDDGVGFDQDREPKGTGLGSKMIGAMARRLNGHFAYEPMISGARAVLSAPRNIIFVRPE